VSTQGASEQSESPLALEVLRTVPGRAVLAEPDGDMYLGHNYAIHRSSDDGRTWAQVIALPRSPLRRAAELSRLACRLLRQEVRALVRLSDGTLVAASREGVFFGKEGEPEMRPAAVEHGDRAPMPPLRLGRGPGDVVVWGEYASALPPKPMRIFVSRDGGRSFQPAMVLERDTIGHVHNVFWDAAAEHYWILAGDHGHHPGIARISADFSRLEWLGKGDQRYRAVHVFDLGDRLLYATDSEVETNRLVSLDKATGRTETLRTFEGSCIYACRFGDLYALTTTVEPSRVNRSRDATLWLSRDGEEWRCAWRARKDRWHADYFQFGSIVLPAGASQSETLVFSGQAVRGLDGRTVVARLGETGCLNCPGSPGGGAN